MKSIIALAALTGLVLATPAFADETGDAQVKAKVEHGTDGSYSEKVTGSSSGTDAAGTYTSEDKKVNVDVDKNGNGKKTTKVTKIKDPKGLFNKTKTVTTDTEKYKNGVTETSHEKTVNGSTVEKTDMKTGQ